MSKDFINNIMKISINLAKLKAASRSNASFKKCQTFQLIKRDSRFKVKYLFDGEILTIFKITKVKNYIDNSLKLGKLVRFNFKSKNTKRKSKNEQISNNVYFGKSNEEIIFNSSKISIDKVCLNTKEINTQTSNNVGSEIACQVNLLSLNDTEQAHKNQENLRQDIDIFKKYIINNNKILNIISETIINQNLLIKNNFELLNNISNILLLNGHFTKVKKNICTKDKLKNLIQNKNKQLKDSNNLKLLLTKTENIGKILKEYKNQNKILENKCNQTDLTNNPDKVGYSIGLQTDEVLFYKKKRQKICRLYKLLCCGV